MRGRTPGNGAKSSGGGRAHVRNQCYNARCGKRPRIAGPVRRRLASEHRPALDESAPATAPTTPGRASPRESDQEKSVAFVDKQLTCRECGVTFLFTAGEQQFYAQKGFTNEPGRCPECRAARRAAAAALGRPMAGGYETNDGLSGEYRRPREYHETVCAACGGPARVPFLPRGDRPVYCSTCFEQQRTYR